jgi:hypothetical protein
VSQTIHSAERIEAYRWLASDDARSWLDLAAAWPGARLGLIERLRRELGAERARATIEQIELRPRAREKFSNAERMFFTRIGLEQATDEWIARYKAERFAKASSVVDFCSGVGGDLAALAQGRTAIGVDRDPVMQIIGAANSGAEVRLADVEQCDAGEFDAWHLDPDRRPEGRRTTRVELHSPGAEAIERMLARCADGAIKLAPAAEIPGGWIDQCEQEWISRRRECRQLVAWFGRLAQAPGERRATVLLPDGSAHGFVARPTAGRLTTDRIARFVFEPDPAILAADLVGPLAEKYCLGTISPDGGYLSGDRPVDDPLMAAFETLDVSPLRIKRLKSLLAERGIGRVEVKKRSVDIEPATLEKQLRTSGERTAVLLVAPVAGKVTAILARRM